MADALSISLRARVKRIGRRMAGLLLDTAAFVLAGILAFELRFDGHVPQVYKHSLGLYLGIWAGAKLLAFVAGKVDCQSWRNTTSFDAARLIFANFAGAIVGGVLIGFSPALVPLPGSVFVLDALLSCLLTLGMRLGFRLVMGIRLWRQAGGECTRTLIYGAGSAGLALLWETRQNRCLHCDVVGLIDDDPSKSHLILQGKRVLGRGEQLGAIARRYAVRRVLIAIPSASPAEMVKILNFAVEAGVAYQMVPGLGELIQDAGLGKQLRDVSVEDLLGRQQVQLELEGIRRRLRGKVILVTGAAGSIGSEICRQVARFRPAALVAFDQAETPLFHLERELRKACPELAFYPEIGDIASPASVRHVFGGYRPSVVYHAAAYKHVPMMEQHVFAAVENNVFGTWNVAQACALHAVDDFVLISTDKAVRPTSVMGATKRVAELAIRALHRERGTKFVAVRFGNVLGSNGSVVPTFKEQIAAGGPVTVTDREMSRYFMTIPEAAQLVLQAHSLGKGGEVFVLDMGQPVKIVDLARNLILLSGLQPDRDIQIQFSGLRPGEKLFEELNLHDENLAPTSHAKIRSFVSAVEVSEKQMRAYVHELRDVCERQDVASLLLLLKELVPEYNPGAHLLRQALAISPRSAAVGLARDRSAGRRGIALPRAAPVN